MTPFKTTAGQRESRSIMSLEEDVRMLLHPNQPDNPFIEWITGFDPTLRYVGFIGGGGQGDVYLVIILFKPDVNV